MKNLYLAIFVTLCAITWTDIIQAKPIDTKVVFHNNTGQSLYVNLAYMQSTHNKSQAENAVIPIDGVNSVLWYKDVQDGYVSLSQLPVNKDNVAQTGLAPQGTVYQKITCPDTGEKGRTMACTVSLDANGQLVVRW